jgi:hypothetical protein
MDFMQERTPDAWPFQILSVLDGLIAIRAYRPMSQRKRP